MGGASRAPITARRRATLWGLGLLALVAVVTGAIAGGGSDPQGPQPNRLGSVPPGSAGPAGSRARVASATALAARRQGRIAFAVTDTAGRMRGLNARQPFVSASIVKAMLLVADLARPARAGRPLPAADRATLGAMIRVSDNEAADAVYRRVGDVGLRAVARGAAMRAFRIGPTRIASCRCRAKGWARAQITAGDQARFMRSFLRLVPKAYRSFARATLAGIVRSQRWGIPQETPAGWTAYFKNGARVTGLGTLVHQVARLEKGERVLTLAILTDGDPTESYGKETVRGLTRVLVGEAAP